MDNLPKKYSLPELPNNASRLLRAINLAHQFAWLYGKKHPNAIEKMQELVDTTISRYDDVPVITYMFAKEAVFVNDIPYQNSADSINMLHKLRMRAVQAITFKPPITCAQVEGLIDFLLEEPLYIIENSDPEKYLQNKGITNITLTALTNVSDDEPDDINSTKDTESLNLRNVDIAVKWLTGNKNIDLPDISLIDLLADTQSASLLVTQAVDRLCKQSFPCSENQITSEIINDFKKLADGDREKWDSATPQIRRSISNLPLHLRPIISGFMPASSTEDERYDIVDAENMEIKIAQIFTDSNGNAKPEQELNESDLHPLFRMKTEGMLSSWKTELEPSSILSACGSTYELLLIWCNSREEHMRIADALSTMVVRAMESDDIKTAIFLVEILIKETRQEHINLWRNTNAREALMNIELSTLKQLSESALTNPDYHHKNISAMLVEIVPELALSMIHLLGTFRSEPFDQSLRNGIKLAGDKSLVQLTSLLRDGTVEAKESALDVLIDIGSTLAMGEIASIIEGSDIDLAIEALNKINDKYNSRIENACHMAMTSKEPDLQLAAINAVRRMNDKSAIPYLESIALHGSLKPELINIRIEAIRTLGEIGEEAQVTVLGRIARNQPLIGRKQYEDVSSAAKDAVEQIRNGKPLMQIDSKGLLE